MTTLRTMIGMLALSAAMLLVAAGGAVADDDDRTERRGLPSADTAFYELTENMSLLAADHVTPVFDPTQAEFRFAMAALQGTAKLGTPWCPDWVLELANARKCTITALGSDDISLKTGTGTVKATWATVVNLDNPVDGPEFVVMTGLFEGNMDLSQALTNTAPLGTLTGQITIDGVNGEDGKPVQYPLTGTFRLPFEIKRGKYAKPGRRSKAYYLDDNFNPVRVRQNEESLGIPTVRLEINFTK